MAGDEKATYLLPNTVVALIWASTFDGISLVNCFSTSRLTSAIGSPFWLIAETPDTRPISTPLKVTFEPGSIDSPDRDEIRVSFSGSLQPPRNCFQISATTMATMISRTTPATLYGGVLGSLTGDLVWPGAVIGYTVRLKLASVP